MFASLDTRVGTSSVVKSSSLGDVFIADINFIARPCSSLGSILSLVCDMHFKKLIFFWLKYLSCSACLFNWGLANFLIVWLLNILVKTGNTV